MLLASSGTSQSLEDKLYAVKYFLSGQGISYMVLKATTTELIGPKKKHLNYLVSMTHEPNVSIPNLVKHLKQRARHPECSVAFKAAITIHHLINYGNEKFIQNLASSTSNHQPFDRSFMVRADFNPTNHNLSIPLRRYWRYINSKIQTYRLLGLDFCRIESSGSLSMLNIGSRNVSSSTSSHNNKALMSENNYSIRQSSVTTNQPLSKIRNLSLKQVMKIIPILQNQFDVLLAFDVSVNDLCNGVINSAFAMLFKDFVKLYLAYQASIIRLLELYFTVNQAKLCSEMLEIYRKFLTRMFEVTNFMRIVDSVGIDKSMMPNISRAPELPLEMLEKHLQTLQSTPRRNCFSLSGYRMQSVELPRLDYASFDNRNSNRRRSLRTPTRQSSIDILSPKAMLNYQQRTDELNHLDKMLGINSHSQLALANDTSIRQRTSSTREKAIDDLIEQPEEDLLLDDPIVDVQASMVNDFQGNSSVNGQDLARNDCNLIDFSINPSSVTQLMAPNSDTNNNNNRDGNKTENRPAPNGFKPALNNIDPANLSQASGETSWVHLDL